MYCWEEDIVGGGLVGREYWERGIVKEVGEDGVWVVNREVLEEVWGCKIRGLELERMG